MNSFKTGVAERQVTTAELSNSLDNGSASLLLKFGCVLLGRAILRERQRKCETTSLADCTLHRDRTAMSLNETLCDSQSQSRPLVSFARAGLMKLLEHGFQLIGRNTHAGIAD